MSVHLEASLRALFPEPPTRPVECLEIGSHTGDGALHIEAWLCAHPESRLWCVDPWEDVYVPGGAWPLTDFDGLCVGQHAAFLSRTRGKPKIRPLRGTSDAQVPSLRDASLDFAYVDGNHHPAQVFRDAASVLPKLKADGVVLFDDYLWEHKGLRTAEGIDRALRELPLVEVYRSPTGHQVAARPA